MRTVRLSWPAMAIVLLALLACLGSLVDADPTQTQDPGEDYSPEDRSRYYTMLRQQYNRATRQRYGKRDIQEADLLKLLYPDIQDSSVEAVLRKLLFPDSQDTSVKSRPEGTYKL